MSDGDAGAEQVSVWRREASLEDEGACSALLSSACWEAYLLLFSSGFDCSLVARPSVVEHVRFLTGVRSLWQRFVAGRLVSSDPVLGDDEWDVLADLVDRVELCLSGCCDCGFERMCEMVDSACADLVALVCQFPGSFWWDSTRFESVPEVTDVLAVLRRLHAGRGFSRVAVEVTSVGDVVFEYDGGMLRVRRVDGVLRNSLLERLAVFDGDVRRIGQVVALDDSGVELLSAVVGGALDASGHDAAGVSRAAVGELVDAALVIAASR